MPQRGVGKGSARGEPPPAQFPRHKRGQRPPAQSPWLKVAPAPAIKVASGLLRPLPQGASRTGIKWACPLDPILQGLGMNLMP
ncbi:hypothetical protein MBAV_000994 [Candidatus Magnetobacterium bavaricum]|uniref:Uncharacterized protein n=1 Tax=Candidatus Magnetobacterium bavaricum TaxID=29290 RepID=A0A0F3GXY9_9BACT|nr:hypothetical protein MBAV_000994 [Candidatus Magnetobacterium bavaricum]